MFSLNLLKYEDIRQQIIDYFSANSDYAGTFDFTGTNISYVVNTMSYIGMMLAYMNANTSNNDLLDTTTIRNNAVSLSKNIGYRPKRVQSAQISGIINYTDGVTNFNSNSYIKINPKSTFTSNTGNSYVNTDAIILTVDPANPKMLTGSFNLLEGVYDTFTFSGLGTPFQSITIPSSQVEETSIELYVKDNTATGLGTKWSEVKSVFNIVKPEIFFIEEDINNVGCPKIIFGNGIIGQIPADNQVVNVNYLISNADAANGESLTSLPAVSSFILSNDISNFSVDKLSGWNSSSVSYGGTSLETLDSIKYNAPRSFASAGRAVTQNDYTTLLEQYPYILKGSAIGGDILFPGDSSKLGNIYITGLPVINKTDFLKNSVIYLNHAQESQFKNDVTQYNVMATKINFLKPSYIYLSVKPSIEYKHGISTSDQIIASDAVTGKFAKHVEENFSDFDPTFRASKINSLMNTVSNIKSAEVELDYYFVINSDSFYELNNSDSNLIYLPVLISGYDAFGQVSTLTNFVKTNLEQKYLLTGSVTGDIANNQKTIYGLIKNDTPSTRAMYNEDVVFVNSNGDLETDTCEIKLDGANLFFSMYRFDQNLSSNVITNVKDALITVSASAANGIDTYTVTSVANNSASATVIGTISRSKNTRFNKGVIDNELTFSSSPSGGEFYEVVTDFTVSKSNKNFKDATVGDYIIFDNYSGKWIKAIDRSAATPISAISGDLYANQIAANSIFRVINSGIGGGEILTPVTSGDRLIYNMASTTNPVYKWEKMPLLPLGTLPASGYLPTQVLPYDVRIVTIQNSNFGGATNTFKVNDLIIYNPDITNPKDRWEYICNVGVTGNDLPTLSAADPSVLYNFQYTGIGGTPIGAGIIGSNFVVGIDPLPIGTAYSIDEIGSFLNSDMIIWPTDDVEDHVAWVNDIIVYVGLSEINGITKGRWKLFSNSMANLFEADGSVPYSLPVQMNYGDFFNISGSGNFNTQLGFSVTATDQIVFLGNSSWEKLVVQSTLIDASSASGLPPTASIGQVQYITEDGNFNSSNLVYPYNDSFSQGDYIIYTGSYWTKLREYYFKYNVNTELPSPFNQVGKNLLNVFSMNSKFYYEYDYKTKYYNFYFNDLYHDCVLGIFTYNSNSSSNSYVGKLEFNKTVNGQYNDDAITAEVPVKSLFSYTGSGEKMNLIRILPKNKINTLSDGSTSLSLSPETDFDTIYNQFVIPVLQPITELVR